MEHVHKNYLGLDWGAAKVGVALAHAETSIALAYGVFKNDDSLLEELGDLILKEEVGTVVIGIPKHDKQQEGQNKAEAFGKLLSERFPVAVEYHDEMFTTKMAQAVMVERGEKNVGARDDQEAARILLQSFLDKAKRTAL